MRAFARQPQPSFWGEYERRWLYETTSPKVDPLYWVRARRALAAWFHEGVRPTGEPQRCAYCDGPLDLESPKTIDHFVPRSVCRELAITWENLYPACVCCNSTHKGSRWSWMAVRPDVDPVEVWFDFYPETGELAPAPDLDRVARVRVKRTIRLFGLNTIERCTERRRFLKTLENALRTRDFEYLTEALTQGPYRFVAQKFMASGLVRKRIASLL